MPTARMRDLSGDARKVHRHVTRNGAGHTYLRHDPLEQGWAVGSGELVVSDRLQSAIDELTSAHLAHWDPRSKALSVRTLSRAFTIAAPGRGDQYVEVEVLDHAHGGAGAGVLLACLPGAELSARTGSPWPIWELESFHPSATDFEHSTSRIASLRLGNPAVVATHGGRLTQYITTLTEARLYPAADDLTAGVDITTVTDGDTRDNDPCTRCQTPHPFAPYLPPRWPELEETLPLLVKVSVYPMFALTP